MMQATDFGNRVDRAESRRLDWPSVGCILVEREVSPSPVIVREVAGQDAAHVRFAQDENVIQTLAPDRADEPLREGILPRAVGRREDFIDSHALYSIPKLLAVDLVTIAKEIGRRGVVREGVHDLLGGPARGRVFGHVEVEDAPAMVSEHDEDEEHPQARGGDREEIDGDQVPDLARNVRQVWEGGMRRIGSSRETVRSATSIPSFCNSPWIRGAPQRGLA